MRQREQIERSWEVTYAPRPDSGAHRLWSRHESSAEAHSAARRARADLGANVRVVRVTRYRLAPLVEIAAWRRSMWGAECGDEDAGAAVNGSHVRVWSNVSGTVRVSRAPRGQGRSEAEAALARLGFRVAK